MKDKLSASDARVILHRLHIPIGQDFHTLHSSQVDELLAEADRVKYRKPKDANGSRGRYFHARLQRLAEKRS